jgi:ectoine hydroxylase-related dioxygenase (phytanoyl-CoA dioxygenase family)
MHQDQNYNPWYRPQAMINCWVALTPETVSIEVPVGGTAFHHSLTWHGSDANLDRLREQRAVTSVCCPAKSRFKPDHLNEELGAVFARHRQPDDAMDENQFPILWSDDGTRTPGLAG